MLAGYAHLLAAGTRLQWDAEAIELGADRAALDALPDAHRGRVRALLAGFWVAERAVAAQLTPFVAASGGEARRCLALQAGDEARHARFFERVRTEVLGGADARTLARPELISLFDGELPAAAARLAAGACALGDAVALYHLVLEAIVLAVGEDALLAEAAGLPGVAAGAARVQADERWHVGLGVTVLSEVGAQLGSIGPAAERAARSWGPEIATPERISAALAAHARRLTLLARESSAAGAGPA